ncbi:MAG: alkaline phosphatase family protein [Acidobacteria bacterium]|nr:alkaline phosphatase family protein [Acidobacteriota bacterium]
MKRIDRREFVRWGVTAGSMLAFGGAPAALVRASGKRETKKKVIVLGIDGLDPDLTELYLSQGKLPTFAKLASEGGFRRLKTSLPPQSPVAWSNFITGMDPGGHGIFDFIHRNPKDYNPYLSTSSVAGGGKTIEIGNYVIPISSGEVKLLRHGDAFWQILERHDIPATVYKIPANFPPAPTKQRTLSGMGTPDLLGTYGIFNYYTTEHAELKPDIGGGEIHDVKVIGGKVDARLRGPGNAFKKGNPDTYVDFTVFVDPVNPVVKVRIMDQEFILKQGEWSGWIRVAFPMIPTQSVPGTCKFYLKQAHPHFKLYVSAVNIDPASPALPISTPESYAQELESKFGPYYTKGLPADTQALDHGVFDEGDFLSLDEDIFREDRAILDYELSRFDSGLLFYYISNADQRQHMFYRFIDKEHPGYDPILAQKYGNVIEDTYIAMDRILAKVLDKAGKDTLVLVMSDHGFTYYRRSFNLTTWLEENGYLRLVNRRQRDAAFPGNTDWSRTRAYTLGLNGLYINRKDREGKGIVAPGAERESLVRELAEKLEAITDPATGQKIISKAYIASEAYHGSYVDEAPDILVGYARGVRCSWATPLGKAPLELFENNMEHWSGDHCMDPDVTPGILFTNGKITSDHPSLCDLSPTMLHAFGIEKQAGMVGSNVVEFHG